MFVFKLNNSQSVYIGKEIKVALTNANYLKGSGIAIASPRGTGIYLEKVDLQTLSNKVNKF